MNGLSQRTRLVAGFAALAIHAAIGAHLMLSSRTNIGEASTQSAGMLVIDLIPLNAEPRQPLTMPSSRGTENIVPAEPRLGRKFTEPGSRVADIKRAAYHVPLALGDAPAASARAIAASAGVNPAVFEQDLLSHIERFRHYPARARRDGIQGVALLSFAMDRNGHVTDAWVEHSSGSVMLDAEALAAIQRAQPLPPIPANMPDRLALVLPIAFTLN